MLVRLNAWWIAVVGDCRMACLAVESSKARRQFSSSMADFRVVWETLQTAAVNDGQSLWDVPITVRRALGKESHMTDTRKP